MDYLFLLPVCFLVLSVVLAIRSVKRGTKTKRPWRSNWYPF